MENREIKFKSLYRGQWYFVKEMYIDKNGKVYPELFHDEIFSVDTEHIKCTVQYTGLKDKNGKEIYEGDICKIHYYHTHEIPSPIGVVKWQEYGCGFSIMAVKDIDGKALTGSYSLNFKSGGNFGDIPAIEIIGNIHENSNLI